MTTWRARLVGLIPKFLLRLFARPYIAGNSLQAASAVVDELWQRKQLMSTLDLLGEGIRSPEDITGEMDEYLRMIDAVGDRAERTTLSLKPTQLGLAIDPALCLDNMVTLLERARDKDLQITIDMEESDYTTETLLLHKALRTERGFENVGTVLQSRLFRTEEDIDTYLDGFAARIRLCLGIYQEPPEIAYQHKPEMKENFVRLARKLWQQGHFVAIATHDEALLRRTLALATELGIPKDQYEVQMLLGVPRDPIHREVLAQDIPVRIYVPYGTTWSHAYAYARRRLVENPSIGIYVAKNILRSMWQRITGKRTT